MMDGIIDRLKDIGLNTYEAKVYLALLKTHPATGYEISKNANVPQARAYDTLKALENQKMVVATGGKPTMYMPVPPDEILERYEKQYQSSIDFLRQALPSYSVDSVEPVHILRGEKAIFAHARQLIDAAQESIFIEMWHEDLPEIELALRNAASRGVTLHIVGYHNMTLDCAQVYQHDLDDHFRVEIGRRWLILTADSSESIVCRIPDGNSEPEAIWTKNSSLVFVIKDFVIHDIFLLDIEKTLPGPLKEAYGSHFMRLSRKIFGKQMLMGAH